MSQQINLFNPIFLKKKKYFSATTMAQALGLIVLGCALGAAYAGYQVAMLAKEAERTTAQLNSVKDQLGKANAAFAPKQMDKSLDDEIRKTEADIASVQRLFDFMQKGDFGNTKGYAEYMRAFARQVMNGVWLTGFHINGAGNEIGLQGGALQPELVPAYINRLKREQILQGKSFAALDMEAPAVDPNDKAGAASRRTPAYIKFRLQSYGLLNESAQSSGAKGK